MKSHRVLLVAIVASCFIYSVPESLGKIDPSTSKNKSLLNSEKVGNSETGPKIFVELNDSIVATESESESPDKGRLPLTTGLDVPWRTISAGGISGTSSMYRLNGGIGQIFAGNSDNESYQAAAGYIYGFGWLGISCDCGGPGDINNDGGTTPLDVSFLVKKVYKSQDALFDYKGLGNCPFENGDVDGSGGAPTPLDVTFLVQKVYKRQDALCQDRCSGTPGNCPGP
jgi:hypothetical protein